jgi:hypothetical protein
MAEQSYLLTDAERDRFAWWLEHQANSSLEMAKQGEKLGIQVLVQKETAEAMAYTVVAKILRSTQSVTIT